MKDLWSAQEIAAILGTTNKWVRKMALQQHWDFEVRPRRGGWQKMYRYESLPRKIQEKLRERDLIEKLKAEDPELGPKLWVVQEAVKRGIGQVVKEWDEWPDWVRDGLSKPSKRTVERWVKAYRTKGIEGLRDRRGRRGKLSKEAQEFIVGLIARQPHINSVAVWEAVKQRWDVSERTVRRFIQRWKIENKEVWTFLNNPDEWRNKYQLSFGERGAKFFCHVWEMDSTPADVMTTDGRYSVIGVIDVYSRKVKLVVSRTSNSVGIAAVLRRALMDWGVPQVVVMDNGKDYVSRHIQSVMDRLGVSVPDVPPYTPEAKPHIERFFGTLAVKFFERQPGFIGHNVAQRQAIRARAGFGERARKPAVQVSLSAAELQARLDRWVEEVYHRAPGKDGKTPNERAAESKVPVARIEDERVLDVLLAPGERRRVQKYGIQWEGRLYTAPELAQIVGRDVEVRVDLWDVGRVYVFVDGEYFCQAYDKEIGGIDYKTYKEARREQKRKVRQAARVLKELGEDVDLTFVDARPATEVDMERPPSIPLVNSEIKEATRAVKDEKETRPFYLREEFWETESKEEEISDSKGEGRWFNSEMEKYEWLRGEAKYRELTEEERIFVLEYSKGKQWQMLFAQEDWAWIAKLEGKDAKQVRYYQ